MFKKATNFLKRTAKKAITSERLKTMALMLVVGTGIAMAQNSAGDYSAGTTALTTVTEEVEFRVNPIKYNTYIKSYFMNYNTLYTMSYKLKVNFNNT